MRLDKATCCALLAIPLLALGCGDDDSGQASAAGASGGAGGSGGMATGGAGASGGTGGETAETPLEFVALVRGQLFTPDLEEAQSAHDAVASGGEADAKAAGDFGHDAMLGTNLLGTTPDAFLGLDRWSDVEGMTATYSDPDFAAAFGSLFAAPPTLETFAQYDSFYGWGDLTAGDANDPHYFVVVRGRLADEDLVESRDAHNAIAAEGEMAAQALGDVAHMAFIGLEDPREFLAIDIWTSDENIEAFYGDPQFAEAFGALFEGDVEVGVYASTDWHQW